MATINKTMKTLNTPNGGDTICYEIVDDKCRKSLAYDWDTNSQRAFSIGELVEKEGNVYEFVSLHNPGDVWNDSEVQATNLGSNIKKSYSKISALNRCFIVNGESHELTNIENVSNYRSGNSVHYLSDELTSGVLIFTSGNTDTTSPYVRHIVNLGTKKWILGFMYRITKLDNNLGNPEYARILLKSGADPYIISPVFNGWQSFQVTGEFDLERIVVSVNGFPNNVSRNQLRIELKNMYLYDATGLNDDFCAYVHDAQLEEYKDGVVTFNSTRPHTDTNLSTPGKAADAKVVGDAISELRLSASTARRETFEFSVNAYINSSGAEVASNTSISTDFIDITDMQAICLTGVMGANDMVHWYNSSKTYLDMSIYANDVMQYDINPLPLRPAGAKYIRITTKKDEPHYAYAYYGRGYTDILMNDIVGDGVADDTDALRRLVNVGSEFSLKSNMRLYITSTITLNPSGAKNINGNGATIIVGGDFYAFSLSGSLATNSNPRNVTTEVLNGEAGTKISNFRITSLSGAAGGGIEIRKSFKLTIEDNIIYKMKNGIRVYGKNRDLMIHGNQIYAMQQNGILFDDGIDLHQCNINNNMVQYADVACIHIYNPYAIANFQIVGNDLEISGWLEDGHDYSGELVLLFEVGQRVPDQFSEIEICGNTIQGHSVSNRIIKFAGDSTVPIRHVSLVGNHISNTGLDLMYFENCENIAISGNTYTDVHGYVYVLDGVCSNFSIVGDTATQVIGGRLHALNTATITNIKCKNTVISDYATDTIDANDVTNVDLTD